MVKANELDEGPIPAAEVQSVANEYGVNRSRFWVEPTSCIGEIAFNNSRGLFKNNAAMRRAFNWALDRTDYTGASFTRTPWTHLLPPDTPARSRTPRLQPYAPTARIGKARRIAAGHFKDGRITVYYRSSGTTNQAQAEKVRRTLINLGFDPANITMKGLTGGDIYTAIFRKGSDFDLAVSLGWCSDPRALSTRLRSFRGRSSRTTRSTGIRSRPRCGSRETREQGAGQARHRDHEKRRSRRSHEHLQQPLFLLEPRRPEEPRLPGGLPGLEHSRRWRSSRCGGLWLSLAMLVRRRRADGRGPARRRGAGSGRAGSSSSGRPGASVQIDPQLAYITTAWWLEYATAAKLYNYPDKRGPAGSVLRPEVASGFKVTNGGRRYTFFIRKGFRFSDGTPVTARELRVRDQPGRQPRPRLSGRAVHHRSQGDGHRRRQGSQRG